jgi:hypothetical protein
LGQKDWLTFRGRFWVSAPSLVLFTSFCLGPFLIEIYDVRKANRKGDVFRGVATAAVISIVIYLVIFFLAAPNSLPRAVFSYSSWLPPY